MERDVIAELDPAPANAPPDAPPDWAALDRDVLCPLCEYNLRGLIEPRCPECGHQFIWAEVLDPKRSHPWLFEHRDRRRIRAFFHTFAVSMLPRRFWSAVRPTHVPNGRRIMFYWLASSSAAGLMIVLGLLDWVRDYAVYSGQGQSGFVGDVWFVVAGLA